MIERVSYSWGLPEHGFALEMVLVHGTGGEPYGFGEGPQTRRVRIRDFFMATTSATQSLWMHVMGNNRNESVHRGDRWPVENVAWNDITGDRGFLERINAGPAGATIGAQLNGATARFRLPSETEWEYAARGGPRWIDGFRFSGSNDVDAVAWYDRNSGNKTHEVAQKAPNQLGIHDMSGNVWEWCQDTYVRDVAALADDGSSFAGPSEERVLRGGCHHNWAAHCTVSKRYAIARDAHDGGIGFRLALSVD